MKPNKLMKSLVMASNDNRYAILKCLQTLQVASYVQIFNFVKRNWTRPIFNYHIRLLKNDCQIEIHQASNAYVLTAKGKSILNLLDTELGEKLMDPDACRNSPSGYHRFVTVCRNCSYVKELTAPKKKPNKVVQQIKIK